MNHNINCLVSPVSFLKEVLQPLPTLQRQAGLQPGFNPTSSRKSVRALRSPDHLKTRFCICEISHRSVKNKTRKKEMILNPISVRLERPESIQFVFWCPKSNKSLSVFYIRSTWSLSCNAAWTQGLRISQPDSRSFHLSDWYSETIIRWSDLTSGSEIINSSSVRTSEFLHLYSPKQHF